VVLNFKEAHRFPLSVRARIYTISYGTGLRAPEVMIITLSHLYSSVPGKHPRIP
jgi:hypothetical protein